MIINGFVHRAARMWRRCPLLCEHVGLNLTWFKCEDPLPQTPIACLFGRHCQKVPWLVEPGLRQTSGSKSSNL